MAGLSFGKILLGVGCALSLGALLLLGTCTACVGKFAMDVSREHERHQKALAERERACDGGDGKQCLELGDYYATHEPEPKPRLHAYERACKLKEPRGCYQAGMLWKSRRRGMNTDPAKAARFLEEACDGAVHDACTELASLYHEGQDSIARDLKAARRFYRKGCNGDAASACEALASMDRADAGSARQSSMLYERACNLGLASSCVFLAEHYFVGYGVSADVDRGRTLLGIACDRKERMACAALQGSRPPVTGNKLATKRAWRQLNDSPSAVAILQNVHTNKDALARLRELRDTYARVDTAGAHPEMVMHIDAWRTWTDDAIRYFEEAARRDRVAGDLQFITVPFAIATEKNERGERDAGTFVTGIHKGIRESHELTADPNAPKEVHDLVSRLQGLVAHRDPLTLRLEMAHGVFMSAQN